MHAGGQRDDACTPSRRTSRRHHVRPDPCAVERRAGIRSISCRSQVGSSTSSMSAYAPIGRIGALIAARMAPVARAIEPTRRPDHERRPQPRGGSPRRPARGATGQHDDQGTTMMSLSSRYASLVDFHHCIHPLECGSCAAALGWAGHGETFPGAKSHATSAPGRERSCEAPLGPVCELRVNADRWLIRACAVVRTDDPDLGPLGVLSGSGRWRG